MKRLILSLTLIGLLFSQDKTYTFTEEEVVNMGNKVKELEQTVDNQSEQLGIY